MNKHGKQKINGNDLKNEETINELFRNWMNFSEWHTARLDEWIDMVSLSTPENKCDTPISGTDA
ncbi:MAG: hypothetical protein R2867_17500 [Caldilineaceae bacterium]